MANKLLGIHLTSDAIKLAEIEQQKAVNWSIDYLPPEKTAEASVKALNAALKNKRISSRQAILTLSGTDVYYNLIELPNMPEKEVGAALRFKLESAFPFPASNAVIDYYKINGIKKEDKQVFFVAAAPKDYINNVIKTVKKAGISIKEIIASSSALISAAAVKEADPCALVYIGKSATSIVLVKQGQAVFAREVAVGGENITRALVGEVQTEAGKLEFDYAKAEEIKNNFGIPMNPDEYAKESNLPPAEIMAMMRPALEKIGDEIQRTFAYYHETSGDQVEFSKAYFTGGVSKTKNFIAYFSAVLGIAILPMPLAAQSTAQNFENDAPYISLAVGAALIKKPFLSLLPSEFKRNYFATVKKHLDVLIGVTLILALVILYAMSLSQYNKAAKELKSLQATLRQQEGVMAQEAALSASFAKEFGSKKTTDRFVKVVGAIHRLTPSEIYLVKMNYVRATNQFIIQAITVKQGGKSIVKNFLDSLKANPLFATIDLSYMTESNAYTVATYDFEIRCALVGETVK